MRDCFQKKCEHLNHEVDLDAKLKHISPISMSSITLPLAKTIMHHSLCINKITFHKFILWITCTLQVDQTWSKNLFFFFYWLRKFIHLEHKVQTTILKSNSHKFEASRKIGLPKVIPWNYIFPTLHMVPFP